MLQASSGRRPDGRSGVSDGGVYELLDKDETRDQLLQTNTNSGITGSAMLNYQQHQQHQGYLNQTRPHDQHRHQSTPKNWRLAIVLETFNGGRMARYVLIVPLVPTATNPIFHVPLHSPAFAPPRLFADPLLLANTWPDCTLVRHRACVRFDRVFECSVRLLQPVLRPSIEEHVSNNATPPNANTRSSRVQLRLKNTSLRNLEWLIRRRAQRQEASMEKAFHDLEMSLQGVDNYASSPSASIPRPHIVPLQAVASNGAVEGRSAFSANVPALGGANIGADSLPRAPYEHDSPFNSSRDPSIKAAKDLTSPFDDEYKVDDASISTATTRSLSSRPGTSAYSIRGSKTEEALAGSIANATGTSTLGSYFPSALDLWGSSSDKDADRRSTRTSMSLSLISASESSILVNSVRSSSKQNVGGGGDSRNEVNGSANGVFSDASQAANAMPAAVVLYRDSTGTASTASERRSSAWSAWSAFSDLLGGGGGGSGGSGGSGRAQWSTSAGRPGRRLSTDSGAISQASQVSSSERALVQSGFDSSCSGRRTMSMSAATGVAATTTAPRGYSNGDDYNHGNSLHSTRNTGVESLDTANMVELQPWTGPR